MNGRLVALAAALAVAGTIPGTARADDDADRAALQAELDALLGEIRHAPEEEPSLAERLEGVVPDIVVLCSSDVRGEVTPCG